VTASTVVAGPGFRAGRPADAARVAADLLDLLGIAGSHVYVTVPPRSDPPTADLHVSHGNEWRRLTELLTCAAVLDRTLTADRYRNGTETEVKAVWTRDGVTVQLWALFKDPEVLAATAWAGLAPGESSGVLDDAA